MPSVPSARSTPIYSCNYVRVHCCCFFLLNFRTWNYNPDKRDTWATTDRLQSSQEKKQRDRKRNGASTENRPLCASLWVDAEATRRQPLLLGALTPSYPSLPLPIPSYPFIPLPIPSYPSGHLAVGLVYNIASQNISVIKYHSICNTVVLNLIWTRTFFKTEACPSIHPGNLSL